MSEKIVQLKEEVIKGQLKELVWGERGRKKGTVKNNAQNRLQALDE